MPYNSSFSYKTYPFLRLLLPLIAGIIIQWYLQPSLKLSITAIAIISLLFVSFTFLKEPAKFISRWLKGILIMLFFVCLGMLITRLNNIENNPHWFGKNYKQGDAILITLQEPLAEKNKSYKAFATVNAVNKDGKWQTGKGDILVYFKKGEAKPNLNYGSQLIIKKPLQTIANSGNPGALDYKRYCLFQDITSQVFLKDDEYIVLPSTNIHPFWQFIFNLRDGTVNTLRRFIPGKKQQSVAEALLIGYRNDLDRDLVQSYSNTGVVHIIAISGLHLGMIYGLMLFIFSRFKKNKILGWLKPVTILSVIWLFTFVAGMAPSVLRASVMFTFIVLGEAISKKNNIYNNLAASAFCLLACNPFMLWDVGFQLSYAAVLSIVIFMHSIYNWLFIKNKLLDNAWKLSSITLSAQILTLPLILYHFHQFSNLFWLTNFIAVPLSGIILYGELILLCFSWLSGFAKFIGIITGWLVERMNSFIESIDRLPFTVWNGIEINILQAIFLYGVLIFLGIWLLNKYKPAFIASLCFLALFSIFRTADVAKHQSQLKLIIYNVPAHTAIDFISSSKCFFLGDSTVFEDNFLRNFHLKPARVMQRVSEDKNNIFSQTSDKIIRFGNTEMLLINHTAHFESSTKKIPVDIIILSKNPNIKIGDLNKTFLFKELVFDSSNPVWKTERWKKECDSLHLPLYSVAQQGAFVMDL